MQSFLTPDKLYFKQGCLPIALQELVDVYQVTRVLIRTDEEMLHNGRLVPLTGALYDMGLDYAVNSESFAADCVILYTGFVNAAQWNALPEVPRILIPSCICGTFCRSCIGADMVILDEDLIPDEPAALMRNRILTHAWSALTGGNASDYTLSWAVQAMRTVFGGHTDKTALLHAFWLAQQAFWNAKVPGVPDDTAMTEEACEALGMTMEELTAKIREVSDEEQQYAATHFKKQ
ncbi:MAG: hypothetical protein J5851_09465 [Oscillospiraceae bacterium]|nr:hypothetical protein [Oscillospiraceae bacterium]